MILPNKYVSPSNSFIGESAKLLTLIGNKKLTIDKLWQKLEFSTYQTNMTFTKYIQVITFMYTCGIISYDIEKGVLCNENLQS